MESRRKYSLAFAVGFLCLAAFAAQSGWHYNFVPAGNFPGAYYSVPLAVSLDHIVGYYAISGANNAYVQTGASFVDAAPSGSITSYLTGINRQGVAVGGFCTTAGGCNPEAGEHGYIYYSKSGKTHTIDFPLQGASTVPYGINDSGVIVGGYCPGSISCPQGLSNPANHGFVDNHGVFTTLDFPNAQATSAFAINKVGTIVGFYIINNIGPHAFLYQNGVFTTIDFPGSGYTVATSINNLGVVAGGFGNSTGAHGFIYYNGNFSQIDNPNATATAVTGINDHNDLVGIWYPTLGLQNFKAFPVKPAKVP
jgi:probable HAF family extracellular repeat protein